MPQENAYQESQSRIRRYQAYPSPDRGRIDLYKGGKQPELELPPSAMMPMSKSLYERPSIETTKTLGGWIENFSNDWSELIKGIGMVIPTIWDSLTNPRDGIIPNIEHLPEIFNRTLPQESRPHSWLKDIPIIGDMDKFQMGRELLVTTGQVVDATVEPYKDGIWEGIYHHPLYLFLDATAVASVMGKTASTAGGVVARTARANAMTKARAGLVQRGLKGAQLDRGMKLAEIFNGHAAQKAVLKRTEAIAKGIAGAPFLPFTGPFKGAHKLLTGRLKDALPGQMYTAFRENILVDKVSQSIHRIFGSFNAQLPMNVAGKGKEILGKLGKVSKAEANFFFDVVLSMDKILKYFPDEAIAREIGHPMVSDARKAVLREKGEAYKRASIDVYEQDRVTQGFLDNNSMTTSRATTALGWIAYRRAQAEIARRIAEGAKTNIFGNLPKAERRKIHVEMRGKLLKRKKDPTGFDLPGDIALREMRAAMDKIEHPSVGKVFTPGGEVLPGYKKEVPYLPFVAERTFDGVGFMNNLIHMSYPEFKQWRADLEPRQGKGMITFDPHEVVMKHLWRQEELQATRKAQLAILEEHGKVFKPGDDIPKGWVPYKYEYLLEKYMPAQVLVQKSIMESYISRYNALKKVHPDDLEMVGHIAVKETLLDWQAGAKGLTETKMIQSMFKEFLDDPKSFNVQHYLPKQAMRAVEAHLEQMTGPMRIYQQGLNVFRFMALNMFPRFYINNFIGNAVLTLFSSTPFKRMPLVKMEEMAEAAQNVLVQETGPFKNLIYGSSWGGSRGYSKFLDWFQKQAEYPGRAMAIAHKLEGLAKEAKMIGTIKAAAAATVAQEDLLRVFLKDYRNYQLRAYRSAGVMNHMDYGVETVTAQMKTRANLKAVEQKLSARLQQMTDPDGVSYGKQIDEKLGSLQGEILSFKDVFADLGVSKNSRFIKEMDNHVRGDMSDSKLSNFSDYLGTETVWDDIAHAAGKANEHAAKEALEKLTRKVNRGRKQLMYLDHRESFVRGTMRLKPGRGVLLTEQDIYRHFNETRGLPPEMQAVRLEDYIRLEETGQLPMGGIVTPFRENTLWKSFFNLKPGARESRLLIQEAVEWGNKYHKANRILEKAQKRLERLDPASLIVKMEKDLAKILPEPEIAKIRHNMMDQSIKYMEQFFGNYNSMHPLERRVVRQLFPFWTFPKTMFKLMWKLPGLRPKTAGLWANFSKYMMDSADLDTLKGRYGNSMILGGDEDGNFVLGRFNSWVPFEAAALGRFGNYPVMPRGLNPLLANPLIKMVVEYQVGHDLFTGRPWGTKAFMTNTGQKFEWDNNTGKFKMVTPQKDFEDGIFSLLPHWSISREMVDPNYKTPKIGDEYIYDRKRWMGLARLLGLSISVTDPERQKRIDLYYRKLILKKIRAAMKHRSTEEKALGRAMLEHLRKQGERDGQGPVWTLNPPFY